MIQSQNQWEMYYGSTAILSKVIKQKYKVTLKMYYAYYIVRKVWTCSLEELIYFWGKLSNSQLIYSQGGLMLLLGTRLAQQSMQCLHAHKKILRNDLSALTIQNISILWILYFFLDCVDFCCCCLSIYSLTSFLPWRMHSAEAASPWSPRPWGRTRPWSRPSPGRATGQPRPWSRSPRCAERSWAMMR